MSYLVLARKYRPRSFSEVVGQEHVTRTLRNAIGSGRLGHAFLFSGLRGVGKTSVARILAKALNCEDSGHGDEPCSRCTSCRDIDEGRSMDVVEMDAASHTGVDDIRELREAVMYAPREGKHKVYIIDEVHMLSKNAFNALLKTLEEPPPRVVFILATTEPHRVPVTIHSRCQRYDFRRIPSSSIASHLGEICGREGIDISRESLRRIAVSAEGSLRDSQSLLDQVLSYSGEQVSDEDVNVILGTLDREMLMKTLTASLGGRSGEALQLLGDLIDNGADPLRIALDLMDLVRSLLLVVEMERPEKVLDLPEGEMESLRTLSSDVHSGILGTCLALLARGEERMRRSPQPRFHLELAIVHMARAQEITLVDGGGGFGGAALAPPGGRSPSQPSRRPVVPAGAADEGEAPGPVSPPAFASIETPEETWEKLVSYINERAPGIGSMLEYLVCLKLAGEELVVGGKKGEFAFDALEEEDKRGELQSLVSEFFARRMTIRLRAIDDKEKAGNATILEKKQIQESDLVRRIRKETLDHQAVKSALEIFQGKVETVTVLSSKTKEAVSIEEKEEEA
ncbi:MAG: DNA polymerase III subunit gamma/tau [bacterium]|nr:MAG: DNA polymerase III subunit gamma/tau [bacterium]